MKALLTAGGRATRLRPISYTVNKHLIPLANRPMIFNALEKIADAGITEVIINVNPGEREIQNVVGDGSAFGLRITFLEQSGGPLGLGHIIRNARPLLGDEPFLFYLGDNIILGSIASFVKRFTDERLDCLLALSRVPDPTRFGVREYDASGALKRIVEKPEMPPSEFAVAGIYVYSPKVFDAVDAIAPSSRGELEISDAHTWLIEHGARVASEEITGGWKETGKPEDLLEGNALLLTERIHGIHAAEATIDPSARIEGSVQIGRGSRIGPGTVIQGPVAIGDGCVISHATIGPSVSIGDHTVITDAEITHSIVFDHATIDCQRKIADSIIGSRAVITSKGGEASCGNKMIVGEATYVEVS